MSDDVTIDDKKYISSKRAAETSGYAQDYIGQLARGGQIDAQRIGGLWFISMESLLNYQSKTVESSKVQQLASRIQNEPESLVSFDGKDYVSAVRASEITGYHQDYVGQLAREGKVLARQIGNRWYVERSDILAHKKDKDALLAVVQAEAVGISHPTENNYTNSKFPTDRYNGAGPYLTYTSDSGDLVPLASHEQILSDRSGISSVNESSGAHPIYIRVLKENPADFGLNMLSREKYGKQKYLEDKRIRLPFLLPAAAVATIVIMLSVGYAWLGEGAIYARVNPMASTAASALGDRTYTVLQKIGDALEKLLVPELVFKRIKTDFNL